MSVPQISGRPSKFIRGSVRAAGTQNRQTGRLVPPTPTRLALANPSDWPWPTKSVALLLFRDFHHASKG